MDKLNTQFNQNKSAHDIDVYENDPVWASMRHEAKQMTIRTPILASSLYAIILNHKTLEASLAFCLSSKIQSSTVTATQWFEIICQEFENDKNISESIRADLVAIRTRDPSCNGYAYALLYLKGFHGI